MLEEETRPDAVPHVVLGYWLWKTRYGDVLRLVLLQGVWLTAVGLAFVLTRFIGGLLYGVSANDPVAPVFVVLGAIALLACYLPARRAMRAEPVAAIREL